jgi:mono/diheme cytochrome c family protein
MRHTSPAVRVAIILAVSLTFLTLIALASQPDLTQSDPQLIERGEYLVTITGCNDCHSPKLFAQGEAQLDSKRLLSGHPQDEKLPENPKEMLGPGKWGAVTNAGLTAWTGPWGTSYAINLTPDKETGLGNWTEKAFMMAMRSGKHRGVGRPILPPMPWMNYAVMTDDDLHAVFAYLQSIPPVRNKVPEPAAP